MKAQQYDQSTLTLDNRALELQKMEEEHRRATNIAIKDFNQALVSQKSSAQAWWTRMLHVSAKVHSLARRGKH